MMFLNQRDCLHRVFRPAAIVGILTCVASSPVHAQQPAAPVVVVPVVERSLRSGQVFMGTIYPHQRATVGSAVDGRVDQFLVREGDRVSARQALAVLLTKTIEQEVIAAQGELTLRQQELEELQNGTRPEELDQVNAQVQAAETAVRLAGKRLARTERLIRSRTVSQDDVDEAQAAADNAQAMLAERKASQDLAVAGPRKERIAQAEARVAIQAAIVEKLEDQLTKHTMIARFDGYVVAEHTEVGEWVNRGDPVAEIVGIDSVEVRANVLESHIPFISPGMEARVEVSALPDRVFTGKVIAVIPQGDERSRTFPVKVRLENEITDGKPLLNVGMLSRVILPTGSEMQSMMVPKDAIVLGGKDPIVYVVSTNPDESSVVTPVPISLGAPSGSLIAVTGNLQPDQLVVVRGNERLRPGQTVQITKKVMDPENLIPGQELAEKPVSASK